MSAYLVTYEHWDGNAWRELELVTHVGWHALLTDLRRLRRFPDVRTITVRAA